jgi:hypothetical protein
VTEHHDLDNIRTHLTFGPEKYKQAKVDLSESADLEIAVVCKPLHQMALGIMRRLFNAAQMRILEGAFREIENSVCLGLGEPGCKKTSTLAYAVSILKFVGYKILVVAEENLFLDNFMIKSEEARRESLDALGDDKSSTFSE